MKYKTDRPFTQEELKAMDVIHDPNTTMFEDQNDKSKALCKYKEHRPRNLISDDFILGLSAITDLIPKLTPLAR